MIQTVRQMSAGASSELPQGFASLRIRGEGLEVEVPRLVIARTGQQGGNEYLRAYNSIGDAQFDQEETLKYRWGADEGRIIPYGAKRSDGELVVDLGRNVNALLDQQTNYKFLLFSNGQPIPRECAIAWTRVPPVRPTDLATFVEGAKEKKIQGEQDKAAPPVQEAPRPIVETTSPPVVVDSVGDSGANAGAASRQTTKWAAFSAGGVLLLIVLAAAYFVWLRPQKEMNPQTEQAMPADPANNSAAPSTPPASAKQAPTETREERLARVIAQSPDVAIEEGKHAVESQIFDEAEFLFRNACTRQKAEGCRQAAQLYDPLDATPDRRTQRKPADARLAVSLYRMAIEAGSPEAGKDLSRLREVIERAAQDGDSAAKVMIDTWPK